jgi:hypothetical protein
MIRLVSYYFFGAGVAAFAGAAGFAAAAALLKSL